MIASGTVMSFVIVSAIEAGYLAILAVSYFEPQHRQVTEPNGLDISFDRLKRIDVNSAYSYSNSGLISLVQPDLNLTMCGCSILRTPKMKRQLPKRIQGYCKIEVRTFVSWRRQMRTEGTVLLASTRE